MCLCFLLADTVIWNRTTYLIIKVNHLLRSRVTWLVPSEQDGRVNQRCHRRAAGAVGSPGRLGLLRPGASASSAASLGASWAASWAASTATYTGTTSVISAHKSPHQRPTARHITHLHTYTCIIDCWVPNTRLPINKLKQRPPLFFRYSDFAAPHRLQFLNKERKKERRTRKKEKKKKYIFNNNNWDFHLLNPISCRPLKWRSQFESSKAGQRSIKKWRANHWTLSGWCRWRSKSCCCRYCRWLGSVARWPLSSTLSTLHYSRCNIYIL